MNKYLPLLIVGAIIGTVTAILILMYALVKDKKESMGFDRKMKDGDLFKRLLAYAKPYWKNFLVVLVVMIISIGYSIISPLLISNIQGLIKNPDGFEMNDLVTRVVIYVSILVVSLVCTYVQSLILQTTGQKIVSKLREDAFTHIEQLSHSQLSKIPVGKLVTRVTNDTHAISHMFTGMIANLVQNCFVIIGVLVAMICLNYMLTLMVLCFVPFIVLFTVIFRKFSRRAYRRVKDGTTDINTYLSENMSGMKIIQIFNRQDAKMQQFDDKNNKLYKAQRGQIFVFGIFRPIIYMLYISSVLCLFFLGSKGVIENTTFLGQVITSETIVAFYMFISKLFNPLQMLAEQFHRLQSAFASAEKIFTVMDIEPNVVDINPLIQVDDANDAVQARIAEDGKTLQWKYQSGDSWQDLLDLSMLKALATNEKQVELRSNNGLAEWKYIGEANSPWQPLVGTKTSDEQSALRAVQFQTDNIHVQWKYADENNDAWRNWLFLDNITGAIDLQTVKGEIQFKNVWFAYNEGEWVLKDVSFKVNANDTVAFVGATGSGKTTILSLLCRNYDIQKGQILLDGIDIRRIKISSLRKHFGQMLQDVFLFAGTIRSNIVLRDENFTDQQIMDACKYVNADSFINRLPNGLDEEVRERGNNFSAGQRQLLSFARTIIHKPEVMILDEATANIDTETEVLIQDSLDKMMNIGTMLIVAHRLSTIQHADNIIVLSHGQIVEQGNHDQLLKQKGMYHELYTLQFTKEQLKKK